MAVSHNQRVYFKTSENPPRPPFLRLPLCIDQRFRWWRSEELYLGVFGQAMISMGQTYQWDFFGCLQFSWFHCNREISDCWKDGIGSLGPWVGLFKAVQQKSRFFTSQLALINTQNWSPELGHSKKTNRSHRKLRKLRKLDTFPRRGKRSNQAIPCHPNCNRRFKTNIRIPGGRCQLNHELSTWFQMEVTS